VLKIIGLGAAKGQSRKQRSLRRLELDASLSSHCSRHRLKPVLLKGKNASGMPPVGGKLALQGLTRSITYCSLYAGDIDLSIEKS